MVKWFISSTKHTTYTTTTKQQLITISSSLKMKLSGSITVFGIKYRALLEAGTKNKLIRQIYNFCLYRFTALLKKIQVKITKCYEKS